MASEAEIADRLKGYIEAVQDRKLDFDAAQLTGKHLINDLAMDSLDIMNFLYQVEENEKVEISEAEMESESLYDFAKLVNHIRAKQAG